MSAKTNTIFLKTSTPKLQQSSTQPNAKTKVTSNVDVGFVVSRLLTRILTTHIDICCLHILILLISVLLNYKCMQYTKPHIGSGYDIISFKKCEDLASFKMLKHPQCTPPFN
jgi:hypothetical protein